MSNKPPIKVAYFSMEIALESDIPTYAGGLGVLAGDLLRSCADMHVPAVGVSLVYKGGFFQQIFNPDGSQSFLEKDWEKSDELVRLPEQITLQIGDDEVIVGCWRYDIVGYDNFIVPVYLLDTDYFRNEAWERDLTRHLYSGEYYARICQEIILGIGGVRMLEKLGYEKIDFYHLNEGHAAFVSLALLKNFDYKDEEVRKKCVFTTHTPVAAGHDSFSYDFANHYAGSYLPWHIKQLATQDNLSMSHLALNMSHYSFGVSQKHGEVARAMFPGAQIDAITNGVHPRSWIGPILQDLYTEFLPEWRRDPSVFAEAVEKIPSDNLWTAHQESKKALLEYINKRLTSGRTQDDRDNPMQEELFKEDILTITFARRAVPYKRPMLLYYDLERFIRIAAGRVQVVHCGKSHPNDEFSKKIVSDILGISKKLRGIVNIVYLENYSPALAKLLVAGSDVWLNNPIRPLEASGTSGMKAAMNGVINFSVLDGWWIEGYQMDPEAGYAIGGLPVGTEPETNDRDDAESLYQQLEHEIIPTYYDKRLDWINKMKHAISLGAFFNTNRCIEQYMEKAWKN